MRAFGAAVSLPGVWVKEVQVASRTTIADRRTGALQIRFENIAPPVDKNCLAKRLAVGGSKSTPSSDTDQPPISGDVLTFLMLPSFKAIISSASTSPRTGRPILDRSFIAE